MSSPVVAPCGAWTSPITPGLLVGATVSLGQVTVDGEHCYWLEGRPAEGGRSVRANAVTTPMRMGGGELAPPPALPDAFPGTLGREVAGAVRMLLSDDAVGVTAGVTYADCGRTLR